MIVTEAYVMKTAVAATAALGGETRRSAAV